MDIIWKNKDGTEKTITSLAPGELYSVLTYFTREWIFKRSSSNDLMYAEANGIKSQFFEGCRFKASPKANIFYVLISSGNSYMILLKL